jgi:hypothetical protein
MSYYTKLLDKLMADIVEEIKSSHSLPYIIPTKDLTEQAKLSWPFEGLPLNVQKVGMSMRRLGYHSFKHSSNLRVWVIEDQGIITPQ